MNETPSDRAATREPAGNPRRARHRSAPLLRETTTPTPPPPSAGPAGRAKPAGDRQLPAGRFGPRSAPPGQPGHTLAVLLALTVALVVAFVLAPPVLAAIGSDGDLANHGHLVGAFRASFVAYWRAGNRQFSPDLTDVVDYWFRFHVVKGAIATALLIVLVVSNVVLWKMFARAGGRGTGKQLRLASAGVLVTALALIALAAVISNVQGMVTPFFSLTPMLMGPTSDQDLSATREQIRQSLADARDTNADSPTPLGAMISDNAHGHWALVVIAMVVAALVLATSVALWKRYARTSSSDVRARRVLASYGTLTTLLTLALVGLAVGNATVATHPAHSLLTALQGGW